MEPKGAQRTVPEFVPQIVAQIPRIQNMHILSDQKGISGKFNNADTVCAISVCGIHHDWFLNGSYLETLK